MEPRSLERTVNSLTAVALLLGLSIAPTVAFLLFWKGLAALRNDALILELQTAHDLELPSDTAAAGFAALRRTFRGGSPLGRRRRGLDATTERASAGRDGRLEDGSGR